MTALPNVSPIRQVAEPNVSIELINPARAREYLGFNTSNRNMRKRVVEAYAADMTNKDWRWNGEGIKFATDGTLLDGQHRLAAIIEAGVPVRMLVIRDLPNETQHTMDTGAKRTFSDILRLRGEANYVTLGATIRGIAAWEASAGGTSSTGKTFTNPQLLHTLERHPWVRDGMTTVNRASSAGLPATVAGVLWWKFMEIDPEDAGDFFDRLGSGENLSAGNPIYTLRKLLAQSLSVRGERNTRYLLAVTIKAWNKYRDGEECLQLKFRTGGASPETFPVPR